MSISIKSKLVLKDLGEPKKIASMDDTVREFALGRIIGIATGISVRTNPDDTVFEGLAGTFEGIPADGTKDTVRASILYLPPGMYEEIADPLKRMVPVLDAEGKPKADKEGNPVEKREIESVRFGVDVVVIRAVNPQGYSWKFRPLMQEAETDPLSLLRNDIAKQAALPAPAKEPAEAETVGAEKPKGKGK